MDHECNWQQALKANGVKTKLWLLRAGHTDPFESRRAVWVDTLHRWFDHYLYGVNNGIENEPAVTIEDEKDVWKDYAELADPRHAERQRLPARRRRQRRRRHARRHVRRRRPTR